MPSLALTDFKTRLTEVKQILDAHGALIRFKRAEAAFANTTGGLADALAAAQHLVTNPTRGRPPQVQALNSAAIALLSAHLQGFITDLFAEAARHLLGNHVPDINTLVDAAPARGNPNAQNITKLFASIGFPDILASISWQRMSNQALRQKLRGFNELRNRIVHGTSEVVRKDQVSNYLDVWTKFAQRLDAVVGNEIRRKMGSAPW